MQLTELTMIASLRSKSERVAESQRYGAVMLTLRLQYEFTGREPMTVPKALEIKEELETIDKLLKQLEEAKKTAQIGIIDMEELAKFAEPGDMEQLGELQQQIQEYLRADGRAARARSSDARRLPDDAEGVSAVSVEAADAHLRADCRRRAPAGIQGPIVGEGAAEMQQTKPYEFGDSVAQHGHPRHRSSTPCSAQGPGLPVRLKTEDIVIHRTRNNPKCATVRAARHERLDALRRPVRQRQAHGAGARRPDPQRISRATSCNSSRCTRSPSRGTSPRSPR